MGSTQKTEKDFMDFLKETFEEWMGQKWDVYDHNQNSFTNAASVFLLGKGQSIPHSILGQTDEFNSCGFAGMISPMIQSVQEKVHVRCNPVYDMIAGDPTNLKTNPCAREPPFCILNCYGQVPASSGEPGVGGCEAGYTPPDPLPGCDRDPNADPATGTYRLPPWDYSTGESPPFPAYDPNWPRVNSKPFPPTP